MRRRSFLVNTAGFAAAIAGGFWLKDNVLWRRPKIVFAANPNWIALQDKALPLPVVKAQVMGREVLALIDSGAQYSVIHSALAAELMQAAGAGKTFDMPMVAYGVGGQAQLGRGTTLKVSLPGAELASLRAAILDLGPLASAEGFGVGLIIGRDVLAEMVLELDIARGRMRINNPEHWIVPPDLRPMTAHISGGDALGVEVSLEGAVVRAVVDTGASAILSLSQTTAQDAGLLDGRREEAGQSIVLGGVANARWLTAETVTIGDRLRHNVRVAVYPDSPLPNYPDALLGIGAFRDQKLAIDLGRGSLYVQGQLDLTVR